MFLQTLRVIPGLFAWSSTAAGRRRWLDGSFRKPQDSQAQSLSQHQGQMVLNVNMESFCGFAGQHGGPAFVHNKYAIHRDGARVERYGSLTAPDSRTFEARIEH